LVDDIHNELAWATGFKGGGSLLIAELE